MEAIINLNITKNFSLLTAQDVEDEVHSKISTLFQLILNHYSMQDTQLQITSSRLNPNYVMYPSATSIIQRYRLVGKRGDEAFTKHIILKLPNRDPKLIKFGVGILHENEILAYQKILPFLDQKIFHRPLPIPEVYFTSKNMMMMEDLRKSKYSIPRNRHKFMNSYECRVIIRTLAMFHARSLVCKIKSSEEFSKLCIITKEVMLFYQQSSILDCMGDFLKKLTDAFERKPVFNRETELAIASLHRIREEFREELKDLLVYHDEFSVFCHGDLRASNIYLDEKVDVKFIDFQQICYSSVARDLVTLFYVNVEPFDMVRFMKSYRRTYLDFLHLVLQEHGIDLSSELTDEWLAGQMKKFRVYGIVYGLWHCLEFYIENRVEPLSIEELCELKRGNDMYLEGEYLQRVIHLLVYYDEESKKGREAEEQKQEKDDKKDDEI